MLDEVKKAYDEIFETIKKHMDLCCFDVADLKRKSECHLYGIELKEKYGLNINPINIRSKSSNRFDDYMHIAMWGEKHNRTISWSDDGTQPEDEMLLSICFPTGAYIFDRDYPKELFIKFFNELKTYNPKYLDTVNHCLYFSMDNAKAVFNNFREILNKYHEINKVDSKQRKITRLQEEMDKLNEHN